MKKIFLSAINVFRELRLVVKLMILAVVFLVITAGSIVLTSTNTFCNSCHVMNPYYDSWKKSSHNKAHCLDCHLEPGLLNYAEGKLKGMSQAIDYMVGRIGTKPSATVKDVSCLRAHCHSAEELVSKNIDYNGIKFTHKNHIAAVVDGINISCGTCHSHFEGDEHFNVSNDVCFTCHFLEDNESSSRFAQTSCQGCHEVPNKVIKRGLVTINHTEFASFGASCEESCHKKEIKKHSRVSDSVCLSCHDFSKEQHVDSIELHKTHTTEEKVECFSCHGKVSHGRTGVLSVSAMIECKSCHSDTHNVQLSVYAAEQHPQDKLNDRILSPMFLTHVACTDCHIEQRQVKSNVMVSIGKVAKAVPRACDRCHKPGTGQRYIPFWQKNIKKLYEQVNSRLSKLQNRLQSETDVKTVQKLEEANRQAKTLLESVASDGSWGVHNFKYIEAMLLKANGLITEATGAHL